MKVAVVGMGLIGGSIYKAALAANHDARGLHHGDKTGFEDAEVVFVCLPPGNIVPWIRENSPRFADGAIVVDICGVKRPVMEGVSSIEKKGWIFIGGHPMAGKEVSGYENSDAGLFKGASMILTPPPGTDEAAMEKLRGLFASLGFGRTVTTTPEAHDEMIAYTSQLCHVIATAYSRDGLKARSSGFSAGSFANMTRIATQDEKIWSELFLSDRDGLLAVLRRFISRLEEFGSALERRDKAAIESIIRDGAKRAR